MLVSNVPQLSIRDLDLFLPLYIVLSTSPDVKQQAKSRRSACSGSSSAFRDVESSPNASFSWSILDVIDYKEREMKRMMETQRDTGNHRN